MKSSKGKKPELINGIHASIPDMLRFKNTPQHVKKEVTMLEAKIKVIKAEDLAVADFKLGFIPIGSDPYVKVRLMKDGLLHTGSESVLYLGKTKVVENNLNPVWEQVFSATVPRDSVSEEALFHLKLFDKDRNSKDDPLGVVKIPLLPWLRNDNSGDSFEPKWYDVEPSPSGEDAQGRVQCSVMLKETKQVIREDERGIPQHFYVIQIVVLEGRGLSARDTNFLGLNASSDPYVEVQLMAMKATAGNRGSFMENINDINNDGILAMGKTEFIPQSLNPVWNESFSTKLPIDELDPNFAHFRLTILDRDEHSEDDLMGEIKIPLHDLVKQVTPNNLSASSTKWYEVPPDSAKGEIAEGKVKCKVSISLQMAGESVH